VSDRIRSAHESVSSRAGDIAAAEFNLLAGEGWPTVIYGGTTKFQDDKYWRDLILFYEYFHGDNGAGKGASHQTGWTGVIAREMHLFATSTAEQFLQIGIAASATELETDEAAGG
jgi:hypothetical protein